LLVVLFFVVAIIAFAVFLSFSGGVTPPIPVDTPTP